jgi:thrombospondin type 3 repeat protein
MMMKTRTLVTLAGAAALASTLALGADLSPMSVTGLSGTLRIQQPIPCDGHIDHTTAVTSGKLELTPADGIDVAGGGKYFSLTRASVVFAPFTVSGSCVGISETSNYGPVRVELARAVSFTAAPTPAPGVYSVNIPRESFLIHYTTTVNGDLEDGTKQPRDNVTGTIDLAAGTVQMHVVLATRVTFRALCTDLGCVINETHDGSLTADITGTIVFPDADGDGVPDRSDNCRFVANPDQTPVTSPQLTPPPAVTLNSCASRAFGRAFAADVCDAGPVTLTNNAPLRFEVGANLVTWRAQDSLARVTTGDQTVTIVDTTPPSFTSVPASLSLTNCGPAALGTPAATDDCAGSPTFSNDAPPIFYVGTTTVTWTARDASGNTSTATQSVNVVDTVAPIVTCVPVSPTGNSFRVSSGDACGAAVIRLGSYVLAEGETIHVNETGQPGVRLVNGVRGDTARHFQVGHGEAIVSATDGSGNVSTVACPVR